MLVGFDLDGTLIDSLGSTLQMLRDSIRIVTGQNILPQQLSRHFGLPEERILECALADQAGEHPGRAAAVLAHYVATLEKQREKINFFPDVQHGLTRLTKAIVALGLDSERVSLALYTARGRQATHVLFTHLKLDQWFKNWVTGSDVTQGKPHPEGLIYLLDRAEEMRRLAQALPLKPGAAPEPPPTSLAQLRPQRVFYIGDSPKDIQLAKAAGATAIGVTWCKLSDAAALQAANPHFMFGQPRELFDYLIQQVQSL